MNTNSECITDNIKILGIFTCYNRKKKTLSCLESIVRGNPELEFTFLAVDDASTDGTAEELCRLSNVEVIRGNGSLYYSGGMRKGIAVVKEKYKDFDYCFFFNDDVDFFPEAISRMVRNLKVGSRILVGATCTEEGNLSYSGVKKVSSWKPEFHMVYSEKQQMECDTFNANCVLIPFVDFLRLPNIDEVYTHSMGDFDYGLTAKKMGCIINTTNFYVGICNENSVKNTWQDTTLPRKVRCKLKESPKGLPAREWFHFVRKHFGIVSACYSSISSFIKILLKK